MFNVLIDTSVWLDIAANQKQTPMLSLLQKLVKEGTVKLLVPQLVLAEFQKNRERVAKASAKSLSSHFQQVKEAIRKADGNARQKDKILDYLADVNHRIPFLGSAAEGILDEIEVLLKAAPPIEASDAVKVRAANRALSRKAPCHHENKNSVADAVIFETYLECVQTMDAPRKRFAFVTHNKSDFSAATGNQKLPHQDISGSFSKIKSMYFINLTECLSRIDPERVTDSMWEYEWNMESRGFTEILDAIRVLERQVWYNRHKYREYLIETGEIKIISQEAWEKGKRNNQDEIIDKIWKGALRAAKAIEREIGPTNLGPWDDFDWGMVNGKLSALRWALGDEWDMLDT